MNDLTGYVVGRAVIGHSRSDRSLWSDWHRVSLPQASLASSCGLWGASHCVQAYRFRQSLCHSAHGTACSLSYRKMAQRFEDEICLANGCDWRATLMTLVSSKVSRPHGAAHAPSARLWDLLERKCRFPCRRLRQSLADPVHG